MSSSTESVAVQTHLNGIIEELMSNGGQMQEKYILPPHQRPHLSEVRVCSESIPVVDLKDLDGPHRKRVVQEIRRACEEDGFFQIVNHGVSATIMKSMMEIAKEFFEMPVEDRACLFSEDTDTLQASNARGNACFSTSFNNHKGEVPNWRDYLIHSCHPLEEVIGSWPEKPAAYREIAGKYTVEVRALIFRLMAAISEALGLASDYLNKIFGKHDHWMALNYYPPCPNPDLTLGVPGHSDVRGITVLMQGDVSGLQVIKNGEWVSVEPIANAFVINLGVQMEAVSNGRFKSAEHRAVTNGSTARLSIPSFYGPSYDAFLSPAASMVDEQHPPLYRGYQVGEFMGMFWNKGVSSKALLDSFKIKYPQDNGE